MSGTSIQGTYRDSGRTDWLAAWLAHAVMLHQSCRTMLDTVWHGAVLLASRAHHE
jgi:hypothetical protein